jgi:hypothetical protein
MKATLKGNILTVKVDWQLINESKNTSENGTTIGKYNTLTNALSLPRQNTTDRLFILDKGIDRIHVFDIANEYKTILMATVPNKFTLWWNEFIMTLRYGWEI